MMRVPMLFLVVLLESPGLFSQTVICGRVTDSEKHPLPGANIYFEGTLEGTTANSSGSFCFNFHSGDSKKIVASYVGYKSYEEEIQFTRDSLYLEITLRKEKNDLGEVVITAGHFAASDEKKSPVLSKLDIATSSGGFGDINEAIASMPGTSNTADEGGLMVRGGERYETATFIDGMIASNPYTAKLPTIPVRGRFSPMLFRGTVFSTGGYSAEYGQALSSALLLKSIALPKKEETFFSLNSAGMYFSKSFVSKRNYFSTTTNYYNLAPVYQVVELNKKWNDPPETIGENLVYRQKIGNTGLLKSMATLNYDQSGLWLKNLDLQEKELYDMHNMNLYQNTTYRDKVFGNWIIHAGLATGFDRLNMGLNDTAHVKDQNITGALKLSVSGAVNDYLSINTGGNLDLKKLHRTYRNDNLINPFNTGCLGTISALFFEADLEITERLLTRIGGRLEMLSLNQEAYVSPRLSMAYKTSANSQFSLAYGGFRQQAQNKFLIYAPNLQSERAEHFIAGFQLIRESRILRIEGYHKNYNQLIKYSSPHAIEPDAYSNKGKGYARGLDIFFRDSKTIRNGDFWLTYSLMDSKREYRDFPKALTPGFVSRHNLALTYKQYIPQTATYVSVGLKYASGRPYINPNINSQVQQHTKDYTDLNLSAFHFFELFNKFTMLYLQINNVLGFDHVFGYRYGTRPNEAGIIPSEPIKPVSKRFFLLGMHVSFSGKPAM